MARLLMLFLVLTLAAGCDSDGTNPFDRDDPADPGDPDGETPSGDIPETLAGDVTRVRYDPAQNTIVVEGLTLDATPFEAVYSRAPALEANVPGYRVYTAQDDALDRHSTAFAAQSNNSGAVRAGVTVTGGPRNRFFGGTYYERDGGFRPPAGGLVTYTGRYAGLTNVGGSEEDLIPVPVGTNPELIPDQAAEVTGGVVMTADFSDNSIEGNIVNRSLEGTTPLPSLVLVRTDIAANGTFFGNVEFDSRHPDSGDNPVGNDIGDYGGIIGGPDGDGLAGSITLSEFDGLGDQLGFENEEEYGIFVLDRCGTPGAADPLGLCASVN